MMQVIPLDPNMTRCYAPAPNAPALLYPDSCEYSGVMPEKKERTVQKPVRMPESWVPRLKALADKLGATGIEVSEAAVIRLALGRGLAALEAEHGIAAGGAHAGAGKSEKGDDHPARKPPKK